LLEPTGWRMTDPESYGRAPTFLLLTGYEQARSVTAALAGDWEAARRVELELPETGVCSGPVAAGGDGVASSCCAPAETALPTTSRIALASLEAASSCCAPTVQATCCEPAAKAACCGPTVAAAGLGVTLTPAASSRCGCQ